MPYERLKIKQKYTFPIFFGHEDSINRFLERERFEPKDLFEEEKNKIEFEGGILSVDDSVLDFIAKPEKFQAVNA